MRARWAYNAVSVLIWLTIPMFAGSAVLLWLTTKADGPVDYGPMMAYTLVLGLAGLLCWSHRNNRTDPLEDLWNALTFEANRRLANPAPAAGHALHAVPPPGPATPPARHLTARTPGRGAGGR